MATNIKCSECGYVGTDFVSVRRLYWHETNTDGWWCLDRVVAGCPKCFMVLTNTFYREGVEYVQYPGNDTFASQYADSWEDLKPIMVPDYDWY